MRRTTRATVAICLSTAGLLAPALVSPAAAASASAAACKDGGHRTATRDDGTTFRNQGDCVRYAARGGSLVRTPVPTLVVTYSAVFNPKACAVVITGSGLKPNTAYAYEQLRFGKDIADLITDVLITDSAGALRYNPIPSVDIKGVRATYSLTGVATTGTVRVDC